MRALPDEFNIPVEDLYLSWARLMSGPGGADYFVLGVDRDLVDSLVQAMRLAGIKDWSMDLKPLALARAANATDAIIASLDSDHMDIVLVRGGHIKELHSAIPDHEGRKANFSRYMEQFVAELVKILSYHHDAAGAGETDKSLTELPILVTGEMIAPANAEGEIPDEDKIIAMMKKLTGHSVSLIMPPVTGPETFNANAYATNIGLFLKTHRRQQVFDESPDHFHDVNIDIVAGKFAKKPVMVPMWYTVAPVVLFLVVFGAWSFNSAYSQNSAEMTRLRTEMEELTAQRVQIKQQADQQTQLEQQVATAKDTLEQLKTQHQHLLAGKGKDTIYIADARHLPADASLTDIAITIDGVRLVGKVTNPFDVITYIRSLEAAGYNLNLQEIDNGDKGDYTFYINVKTGLDGENR